jgi:actin-related protein
MANNFASKNERERVSELLFEKANIPNLFFVRNCVLSAFSAGR